MQIIRFEKVINYDFNKSEIENSIQELEKKIYKNELDKNLLRKYKSELDEYIVIKTLDENENIKAIKYIRDLTSKDIKTFEDFEQNTLNCVGADLITQTIDDKFFRVDIKVLDYYSIHYKTNKKYNGNLTSDKWGLENFIFQVEGKMNSLGWANNRYKQTDVLMIYIKATKKIYSFNYKNLVKWLNDKINKKEITEKDYIIFNKGYRATKTRECIVSIPCDEIPNNVINKIYTIA